VDTTTRILSGAAIVALIATAFASVESRASTPHSSSRAEQAATAELNRDIILQNAAVDARNSMLEARYQEEKRQREAQQKQQAEQNRYQDTVDR
jgi:hypothetical protein